jgi:hypothetical protein
MSRTMLVVSNYNNTAGSFASSKTLGATLTTSTNVKIECSLADANYGIVILVVEFYKGVSVQRGETTAGTVTISAVDTSKSFATLNFIGGTDNTNGTLPSGYANITNSTTIAFGGYLTYKNKISWEVISYN